MKIVLPPPRTQTPPTQTFRHDFQLLLANQLRVSWNKVRHWSARVWLLIIVFVLGLTGILVSLGVWAHGALASMSPDIAQGFLSLIFMMGLAGQVFFGVTAAFATLYMSDDLELLFTTPIPLRVIFAVKSLLVAGSNLVTATLFVLLPGVFYGLLFQAGALYYLFVVLVVGGLLILGTALAELLNLVVMRIVPPHRSREAVGFIGAIAGIMIALVFQIPGLMMAGGDQLNISVWLTQQDQLLRIMNFFPWGWGSLALTNGMTQNITAGLGYSLLLLAAGIAVFMLAFLLLERGFRLGWVALSQGEGGRRRRKNHPRVTSHRYPDRPLLLTPYNSELQETVSPSAGMWAVAKKDLLYMRRDTREWFGYLAPIIIMLFFIGQFLFLQAESTLGSLISVLIIYTMMFSGNMALQSFGREGESDWFLNSVPLAGWPVVWGKLLAAVIPTLILMQTLLVGTAVAIRVSASLTLMLAVAAILLTLGASAIGLFYSINNCRYNPDSPQHRISPGASMLMYFINFGFIFVLAIGLVYLIPPAELVAALQELPAVTLSGGFLNIVLYGIYLITRPLLWAPAFRILTGIIVAGGTWSLVFFGFMAATVRQSRKGFRVELVTGGKSKARKNNA